VDDDGFSIPDRLLALRPRLLLNDPTDPEPSRQLGFDFGPLKVAVSEQHGRVKHQVSDLFDEMFATGVTRLVTGLDDLRRLFDDFGANPGHAATQETHHVRGLGRWVILAIGDDAHQGCHYGRFRHDPTISRPKLKSCCLVYYEVNDSTCIPGRTTMTADPIEYEHGVAIPGRVLPEAEWAKTAVKRLPVDGPLDWPAFFGRNAPVVLDLGCGNGRFTLMSAVKRPELDHFAIDFLPVVIRYATRRANQRGLHNVRFAVKDSQTFMDRYVARASVAEVHVYHPQPYHDPRKAFLRVLTPQLLVDVHNSLVTGGLFVVQTDNPDYWEYMTTILPSFFDFHDHPEPWPDAPEGRTRREILARQRGLKIFRGVCARRDDLSPEALTALVQSLPLPTFRSRGPWCELDQWEAQNR
jgi:tRNA (guanine-N7-)-methyltransferase